MAEAPARAMPNKGTGGGKPNPQGKRNPNPRPNFCQSKFEGRCDDLNGHIYDCKGGIQADQYAKTTKEIGHYVGRTYKTGADVKAAIEQIDTRLPTIIQPADPLATATPMQIQIWEKQIDNYVKCVDQRNTNLQTLYDGIELLKTIKQVSLNFQSQKYLAHTVNEAKRRFFMTSQGRQSTVQEYLEQLMSHVDVLSSWRPTLHPMRVSQKL
jgi:hypothetical protein